MGCIVLTSIHEGNPAVPTLRVASIVNAVVVIPQRGWILLQKAEECFFVSVLLGRHLHRGLVRLVGRQQVRRWIRQDRLSQLRCIQLQRPRLQPRDGLRHILLAGRLGLDVPPRDLGLRHRPRLPTQRRRVRILDLFQRQFGAVHESLARIRPFLQLIRLGQRFFDARDVVHGCGLQVRGMDASLLGRNEGYGRNGKCEDKRDE
mmetsp:Transcript_6562/g.17833  ORF Transcript_6562/g.17833 Transcript_6562/m.17833 type:complete len:204 (+) Transcript_6562:1317-1928(+)